MGAPPKLAQAPSIAATSTAANAFFMLSPVDLGVLRRIKQPGRWIYSRIGKIQAAAACWRMRRISVGFHGIKPNACASIITPGLR